jgi:hypothetical protein
VIEQRLAAHDFVGVVDEVAQDAELARRELERHAGLRRLIRAEVELHFAERVLVAGGDAMHAAEHGLDAREELHEAERLGHVVVGAELQADDLVDLLPARGQHDHRSPAPVPAQLLADIEAAFLRQHDVEHDQVVISARREPQTFVAVAGHLDGVFLELEAVAQRN